MVSRLIYDAGLVLISTEYIHLYVWLELKIRFLTPDCFCLYVLHKMYGEIIYRIGKSISGTSAETTGIDYVHSCIGWMKNRHGRLFAISGVKVGKKTFLSRATIN